MSEVLAGRTMRTLATLALIGSGVLLCGQSGDDGKFPATLLRNRYRLSVRNGQLAGTRLRY
jgi:hypothetical protein